MLTEFDAFSDYMDHSDGISVLSVRGIIGQSCDRESGLLEIKNPDSSIDIATGLDDGLIRVA